MAKPVVESGNLIIKLSPWEKVGALRGDLRVPLSAVSSARVTNDARQDLRGMRFGTGVPGAVALGTWFGTFGKDFVAVYGSGSGIVVELDGASYKRIVMTVQNPEAVVAQLTPWHRRFTSWMG